MAGPSDQQKVNVTINGNTVGVPPGLHNFQDLAARLGLAAATKKLTITDVAARSSQVYNPNMSVSIQGGETITSA